MRTTSNVVDSLGRSGIRDIMELAWERGGAIHLEVGEPNFDTPAHVVEAARRAGEEGFTKYTPNAGIPELREALAGKVRRRNGIEASPDDIVVTPGAVAGVYGAIVSLCDPGEEILISDPAWPNYRLMTDLSGVVDVPYPLLPENDFIPQAELMEPLITDRTRAILLNSPGNPTGAATPRSALLEILELARRHDLWVLSDEVYDEIWYEEPPPSAAPLDKDGRVVSFFSFSKTYAMTGWRVGYLVSPPEVTESILKVQEPITSCVNSPAQKAAIAAITGPQEAVAEMRDAYRGRRDMVMELLDEAEVPYVRPAGAFYQMVNVSGSGLTADRFARRLVTEQGVAVVPGETFGPGAENYVRVSLATAPDLLKEGVTRMIAAIGAWGAETPHSK